MPLKKLDDPGYWKSAEPCPHPEHNPPNMIVLEPGRYEYTCPGCGRVTLFIVPERPRL